MLFFPSLLPSNFQISSTVNSAPSSRFPNKHTRTVIPMRISMGYPKTNNAFPGLSFFQTPNPSLLPTALSEGYTTRSFASAHPGHLSLSYGFHTCKAPTKVIGTAVDHRFALCILTDALHLYSRCSMVEWCTAAIALLVFLLCCFFDEGGSGCAVHPSYTSFSFTFAFLSVFCTITFLPLR